MLFLRLDGDALRLPARLPGVRRLARGRAARGRRARAARRAAHRYDARARAAASTRRSCTSSRCRCSPTTPDSCGWPSGPAAALTVASRLARLAQGRAARRATAGPTAAGPGRRRGALRPVRRADPAEHRHLRRPPRAASCCARAGRARCSSTAAAAGGGHLRLVPTPARAGRLRARRRGWDRAADPGRHGVLLPQHARRGGSSPSTRARWAPRSRCSSSTPGRSSRRATPCSASSSPTSRRCWSAARAACAEHWLVPIDDCYELVGVIRTRWRGFGGGEEVWEEIDALLRRPDRARHQGGRRAWHEDGQARRRTGRAGARRPASAGQRDAATTRSRAATCPTDARTAERSTGINPRRAADRPADAEPLAGLSGRWRALSRAARRRRPRRSSLRGAARGAGARRGADAALRAADRRAAARAVRSVLLEIQVRIAATGAATTRPSRSGSPSCSARPSAGATTLRDAACGRNVTLVVPPFDGATVVDLPVPCTLRLRGDRGEVPRRLCATARCRSSCCSAARSSTPTPDGRCR